MPGWWNSLDALRSIVGPLRWAGVAVTAFGVIIGMLSVAVQNRVDRLAREVQRRHDEQQRAHIAEAHELATAATKQAESEREARLASEARERERATPRTITDEQRKRFLKITGTSPKGQVDRVWVSIGDGESMAFARQLIELLRAGGWNTPKVSQGTITKTTPPGVGVAIQVPRLDDTTRHAGLLQEALNHIGVSNDGRVDPGGPPLTLFVVSRYP
jgi:hypothetical protein